MKKPKPHWYLFVPLFHSKYNDYRLIIAILRYLFVPRIRVNLELKYTQKNNLSIPEIHNFPQIKIEWGFFGFYWWKGSVDYWERYVWLKHPGIARKDVWEQLFDVKWNLYER